MQKEPIFDLISSFNEQSDKVKNCLIDLLDIVKDGRVPSSKAMSDLESCITELRTRYDAVYTSAQDTISAEELPENGAAVGVIHDAVKNSRTKYISKQLERARNILEKFVSIKSLIDEYASALAPYQSAAMTLLDQMSEDTVEELFPQTEGPELFLQAMETENIHSPTYTELLEKVRQYYPNLAITIGLATKQFCFNTQDNEPQSCTISEVMTVPETASDPVISDTEVAYGQNMVLPDAATDSAVKKSVQEKSGSNDKERTGTVPVLNKVKIGTPSASNFRKEISKLSRYYQEIKTILPLFTNLGVMSKPQIYMLGFCMDFFGDGVDAKGRVYSAVDMLVTKGYLAEFRDNEDTELYCMSGYSCGCLYKESIKQSRNIFNISVGNVKFFANTEVDIGDALRRYLTNNTLLMYLRGQRQNLSAPEYVKIIKSIKWCDDHYQVAFYDEGVFQTAYLGFLTCADDKLAASNIQEKYIIVFKKDADSTLCFNTADKKVIVVEDEKICFCESKKSLPAQIDGRDVSNEAVSKEMALGKPSMEPDDGTEPSAEIPAGEVIVPASEMPAETFASEKKSLGGADDSPSAVFAEAIPAAEGNVLSAVPLAEVQNDILPGDLTPQVLLDLKRTPSDAEFCCVVHQLLSTQVTDEKLHSTIVSAVLLARGAGLADNCPASKQLSAQLRLATMLMLDECNYTSEYLSTAFGDVETEVPALTLAAYMYALLVPAVTYDYGLKAQTEQFLSDFDDYFEELTAFKALFNKLLSVRTVKASGFTPAAIALLGNEAENERFMKALRQEAKANLTVNTPKTRMKALPILYSTEFGIGSELRQCMEVIARGCTDAESLEWVEAILSEYCTVSDDEYCVEENKIEERLNQAWNNANSKSKFKLEYDARDQALRQYRQRLAVMVKWVEHIHNSTGNRQDIERLKVLRKEILGLIADIGMDHSWRGVKDANVLAWLLIHMKNYLKDSVSYISIYSDLLYTGVFSLSNEGVPEIDTSLGNLKYYEVWRNALRHIVAPKRTIDVITAEILGETVDSEAGLKDNLRQLSLLGKIVGSDDEVFAVSEEQAKEAADSANIRTERFKDMLELAYTYYQINETEKENLAGIMIQYKSAFYEIGDFAAWRRFLEALEMQIREFADGRKARLRSRLDVLLAEDSTSTLLLEAERLLEEDSNFAVTEEYLNRYEAGERELDNVVLFDNDYFSDFLTPSVYDPLLQECVRSKGRALKSFGWNYLEKHLPKDWTARLREDSKALVSNWPARKDTEMLGLLKGLGIDATAATKVVGKREEMWQLSVKPTARSLADYLHPIAAFGTQMKSPLQIIFLYGSHTPQQLVDTVTSMNLGTMSIVFVDQPIDAAARR